MVWSRRELLQAAIGSPPVAAALREMEASTGLVPTLKRVNVPVPGLDRRLDGMRIGQISDTHIGAFLGVDHLQRAIRLLDRERPHIFTMTGDLLDDVTVGPACFDLLSRAHAPYGRFFIMGNHDNRAGRDEMVVLARRQQGLTTLINEELDVDVQGARFHVSGVDYPHGVSNWAYKDHISNAFVKTATERGDDGDFRLCLVHHPDNFDAIAERKIELTLSGHTHGGQVAPLKMFTASMFKYVLGMYRQDQSNLYVSGGTGHWLPVRVGVPAEVTLLTLRRV